MVIKLSARAVFSVIALLCTVLLATAYQLQYGTQHQQPCPLCILQRYAYMSIAIVALIGVLHGPRRTTGMIYNTIIALIASTGASFAIWQLSKGDTMQSCLADPVGTFVNTLPSANWWPEYLFATGGCADKYPPILGITLAAWSLIWFGLLAAFSTALMIKAARARRADGGINLKGNR